MQPKLVDTEETTLSHLMDSIKEISEAMTHIYDTCYPNMYKPSDIKIGDITPYICFIKWMAKFAMLCEKKIRIIDEQIKGNGKHKHILINDRRRTSNTLIKIQRCIYLLSFGFSIDTYHY